MNDVSLNPEIVELEAEMEYEMPQYPVIPNPEGEPTEEITKMGIDDVIYEVADAEARATLPTKVDKVEGKGLSTNDYTDTDKAIVDGVTSALDGKVDKVQGKGLSTNDYDDTAKAIVDGVTSALELKADKSDTYTKSEVDSALDNKVDKVEGKGLSENDFTDTLKDKLDGIEEEANKTIVDNALDGTSANPVENRVVKSALDEKLNADETAVNSNGLVIATPVTDTAPYIYRQTPVKESFKALMKKIVGASVVLNQLAPQITSTNYVANVNANITYSNNKVTCVCVGGTAGIYQNTNSRFSITGHKYLISIVINTEQTGSFQIGFGNIGGSKAISDTNKDMRFAIVQSATADGTALVCYKVSSSENDTFTVSKYSAIDLTAMFGTTIADYVYTLETSQSGSGIAWLQSYGFFTEDYYAYKQNKLESGCVSAKKIVGKNKLNFDRTKGTPNPSSVTAQNRVLSTNNYFVGLTRNSYYTEANVENASITNGTIKFTAKGGGYGVAFPIENTFTGQITISAESTTNAQVGFGYYDDEWNFLNFETNPFDFPATITPNSSAKYISIVFVAKTINTETIVTNPQVEIGSTATSYEPYTETTYPISPITLRGLFKLSTDKLTVDGDEYNADGSVTRKYGIVTFSGNVVQVTTVGDYSRVIIYHTGAKYPNPQQISDYLPFVVSFSEESEHFYMNDTQIVIFLLSSKCGTTKESANAYLSTHPLTVIYELATPTTEQTTPFTETEIVGSTEEFIDYEVAQGNRDVAIPVGTETDYYQEMKLPSLPTTSGNHNLIYNIATGFGWS